MQARNEVGESAWSDVVAYMTKATVPGDPQAPALISAGRHGAAAALAAAQRWRLWRSPTMSCSGTTG